MWAESLCVLYIITCNSIGHSTKYNCHVDNDEKSPNYTHMKQEVN
jgi:hypothetical protein